MEKKNFWKDLGTDLISALTVSFPAISLAAVFGSLTPMGVFAGIVAGIIIPIITSMFGGTRIQSSGPTGPMTSVYILLVAFAYDSFGENSLIAGQFITLSLIFTGLFLIIAGLLNLGKYISKTPQIIIIGFMNAIAITLWLDQAFKLFGVAGKDRIEGDLLINIILTISTFLFIINLKNILSLFKVPDKISKFAPGVLISILIFTIIQNLAGLNVETVKLGVEINSLNEYLNLILNHIPSEAVFKPEILTKAISFGFELSLLAYFDSLLTSMIVDKMTKEKTNKKKELIAQGLANGLSGILGGLPGAQATVNSTLLVKEGAKTRFAGIMVGVFVLIGIIFLKNFLGLISVAIFSGIIIKIALDIFDHDFLIQFFKKKWYTDFRHIWQLIIISYTTIIALIIDLNVAVLTSIFIFFSIKLKKFRLGFLGINLGICLYSFPLKDFNFNLNSINFEYFKISFIFLSIFSLIYFYFKSKNEKIYDITDPEMRHKFGEF